MKKFLLALLVLTMPHLVVMADDQELPNTMLVTLADGSTQEFALNQFPEITFEGTSMVVTSKDARVVYTREQLDHYQLVWREYNSVALVTSDENVVHTPDAVLLHSVRPGETVSLFSVDGRLIMRTVVDHNGDAIIPLSSLGQGIYLLNVNKFTTKIIKP